jgi:hypothetical protein
MKHLLKYFSAIVGVAWSGFLMAQTSPPPVEFKTPPPTIKYERKEANKEAKIEINRLLELKDYASLSNLVEYWKTNLAVTTKESLQDMLFWKITNTNVVGQLNFEGAVPHGATHQDLSIVNGRIAWALEHLIGFQLPAMVKESTPEDIQKLRQMVDGYLKKENQKIISREKAIWAKWVTTLSTPEKLRLAEDPKTDEYALTEFVKDGDVEVRRATAANFSTPLSLLDVLRNDSDDKVKSLADDNLKHARSLNLNMNIEKQ